MSCPNCGGETGSGTPDDPHYPYHNDPPPEAVFCSEECLKEYDTSKIPNSFGIVISSPEE